MNKRARHARRILREHRRNRNLYLHTSRDFKRPALEVHSFWTCPRCLKRSRTPFVGLLEAAHQASAQLLRNVSRTATPWPDLKAELDLDTPETPS